ncbi:hypothetical protein OPT61_g4921 [Boeremia exigua]|uniref:Uncharacterized protein n=1 Tax=Boeremia exigua TaxID=749465 RepID=A0ACC2ICD2_9PLEO|nr:hypothetical protein OPT61_g4921 [Boeremia exigua]
MGAARWENGRWLGLVVWVRRGLAPTPAPPPAPASASVPHQHYTTPHHVRGFNHDNTAHNSARISACSANKRNVQLPTLGLVGDDEAAD